MTVSNAATGAVDSWRGTVYVLVLPPALPPLWAALPSPSGGPLHSPLPALVHSALRRCASAIPTSRTHYSIKSGRDIMALQCNTRVWSQRPRGITADSIGRGMHQGRQMARVAQVGQLPSVRPRLGRRSHRRQSRDQPLRLSMDKIWQQLHAKQLQREGLQVKSIRRIRAIELLAPRRLLLPLSTKLLWGIIVGR